MFNKIRTWIEILKLGSILKHMKEANTFYQGNIIKVLKEEGLFDFLQSPRDPHEISNAFNYTDLDFLQEVLNVLYKNESLKRINGKYVSNDITINWIKPDIMTPTMIDVYQQYANAIPQRLQGKYLEFTNEFNLFNWDDTLVNRIYEQLRKAAFVFAGAVRYSGRFLDVGCANGYGTSRIWYYYYLKNKIQTGEITIDAFDINEELLQLARNEFPMLVEQYMSGNKINLEAYTTTFPNFFKASVTNIPVESCHYDVVYVSQVLHWTNPKHALEELLRVCKPGGLIFGTQMFAKNINDFCALHVRVIEGAKGHITQDEFVRYAKEAGAENIDIATPISVFKMFKRP